MQPEAQELKQTVIITGSNDKYRDSFRLFTSEDPRAKTYYQVSPKKFEKLGGTKEEPFSFADVMQEASTLTIVGNMSFDHKTIDFGGGVDPKELSEILLSYFKERKQKDGKLRKIKLIISGVAVKSSQTSLSFAEQFARSLSINLNSSQDLHISSIQIEGRAGIVNPMDPDFIFPYQSSFHQKFSQIQRLCFEMFFWPMLQELICYEDAFSEKVEQMIKLKEDQIKQIMPSLTFFSEQRKAYLENNNLKDEKINQKEYQYNLIMSSLAAFLQQGQVYKQKLNLKDLKIKQKQDQTNLIPPSLAFLSIWRNVYKQKFNPKDQKINPKWQITEVKGSEQKPNQRYKTREINDGTIQTSGPLGRNRLLCSPLEKLSPSTKHLLGNPNYQVNENQIRIMPQSAQLICQDIFEEKKLDLKDIISRLQQKLHIKLTQNMVKILKIQIQRSDLVKKPIETFKQQLKNQFGTNLDYSKISLKDQIYKKGLQKSQLWRYSIEEFLMINEVKEHQQRQKLKNIQKIKPISKQVLKLRDLIKNKNSHLLNYLQQRMYEIKWLRTISQWKCIEYGKSQNKKAKKIHQQKVKELNQLQQQLNRLRQNKSEPYQLKLHSLLTKQEKLKDDEYISMCQKANDLKNQFERLRAQYNRLNNQQNQIEQQISQLGRDDQNLIFQRNLTRAKKGDIEISLHKLKKQKKLQSIQKTLKIKKDRQKQFEKTTEKFVDFQTKLFVKKYCVQQLKKLQPNQLKQKEQIKEQIEILTNSMKEITSKQLKIQRLNVEESTNGEIKLSIDLKHSTPQIREMNDILEVIDNLTKEMTNNVIPSHERYLNSINEIANRLSQFMDRNQTQSFLIDDLIKCSVNKIQDHIKILRKSVQNQVIHLRLRQESKKEGVFNQNTIIDHINQQKIFQEKYFIWFKKQKQFQFSDGFCSGITKYFLILSQNPEFQNKLLPTMEKISQRLQYFCNLMDQIKQSKSLNPEAQKQLTQLQNQIKNEIRSSFGSSQNPMLQFQKNSSHYEKNKIRAIQKKYYQNDIDQFFQKQIEPNNRYELSIKYMDFDSFEVQRVGHAVGIVKKVLDNKDQEYMFIDPNTSVCQKMNKEECKKMLKRSLMPAKISFVSNAGLIPYIDHKIIVQHTVEDMQGKVIDLIKWQENSQKKYLQIKEKAAHLAVYLKNSSKSLSRTELFRPCVPYKQQFFDSIIRYHNEKKKPSKSSQKYVAIIQTQNDRNVNQAVHGLLKKNKNAELLINDVNGFNRLCYKYDEKAGTNGKFICSNFADGLKQNQCLHLKIVGHSQVKDGEYMLGDKTANQTKALINQYIKGKKASGLKIQLIGCRSAENGFAREIATSLIEFRNELKIPPNAHCEVISYNYDIEVSSLGQRIYIDKNNKKYPSKTEYLEQKLTKVRMIQDSDGKVYTVSTRTKKQYEQAKKILQSLQESKAVSKQDNIQMKKKLLSSYCYKEKQEFLSEKDHILTVVKNMSAQINHFKNSQPNDTEIRDSIPNLDKINITKQGAEIQFYKPEDTERKNPIKRVVQKDNSGAIRNFVTLKAQLKMQRTIRPFERLSEVMGVGFLIKGLYDMCHRQFWSSKKGALHWVTFFGTIAQNIHGTAHLTGKILTFFNKFPYHEASVLGRIAKGIGCLMGALNFAMNAINMIQLIQEYKEIKQQNGDKTLVTIQIVITALQIVADVLCLCGPLAPIGVIANCVLMLANAVIMVFKYFQQKKQIQIRIKEMSAMAGAMLRSMLEPQNVVIEDPQEKQKTFASINQDLCVQRLDVVNGIIFLGQLIIKCFQIDTIIQEEWFKTLDKVQSLPEIFAKKEVNLYYLRPNKMSIKCDLSKYSTIRLPAARSFLLHQQFCGLTKNQQSSSPGQQKQNSKYSEQENLKYLEDTIYLIQKNKNVRPDPNMYIHHFIGSNQMKRAPITGFFVQPTKNSATMPIDVYLKENLNYVISPKFSKSQYSLIDCGSQQHSHYNILIQTERDLNQLYLNLRNKQKMETNRIVKWILNSDYLSNVQFIIKSDTQFIISTRKLHPIDTKIIQITITHPNTMNNIIELSLNSKNTQNQWKKSLGFIYSPSDKWFYIKKLTTHTKPSLDDLEYFLMQIMKKDYFKKNIAFNFGEETGVIFKGQNDNILNYVCKFQNKIYQFGYYQKNTGKCQQFNLKFGLKEEIQMIITPQLDVKFKQNVFPSIKTEGMSSKYEITFKLLQKGRLQYESVTISEYYANNIIPSQKFINLKRQSFQPFCLSAQKQENTQLARQAIKGRKNQYIHGLWKEWAERRSNSNIEKILNKDYLRQFCYLDSEGYFCKISPIGIELVFGIAKYRNPSLFSENYFQEFRIPITIDDPKKLSVSINHYYSKNNYMLASFEFYLQQDQILGFTYSNNMQNQKFKCIEYQNMHEPNPKPLPSEKNQYVEGSDEDEDEIFLFENRPPAEPSQLEGVLVYKTYMDNFIIKKHNEHVHSIVVAFIDQGSQKRNNYTCVVQDTLYAPRITIEVPEKEDESVINIIVNNIRICFLQCSDLQVKFLDSKKNAINILRLNNSLMNNHVIISCQARKDLQIELNDILYHETINIKTFVKEEKNVRPNQESDIEMEEPSQN